MGTVAGGQPQHKRKAAFDKENGFSDLRDPESCNYLWNHRFYSISAGIFRIERIFSCQQICQLFDYGRQLLPVNAG
jgi:hypothetical protein